jgi:hypothetical protein
MSLTVDEPVVARRGDALRKSYFQLFCIHRCNEVICWEGRGHFVPVAAPKNRLPFTGFYFQAGSIRIGHMEK